MPSTGEPSFRHGGGLQLGGRVRFSPAGAAKIRAMPEAWGLHTALTRLETGIVTEVDGADDPFGEVVISVDFPSGSAGYWDADCFEPIP